MLLPEDGSLQSKHLGENTVSLYIYIYTYTYTFCMRKFCSVSALFYIILNWACLKIISKKLFISDSSLLRDL